MTQNEGTLRPVSEELEGVPMPAETHCIKCVQDDQSDFYTVNVEHHSNKGTRRLHDELRVQAIFGCTNGHPLHEWPVVVYHNRMVSTDESLDPIGTDALDSKIADGFQQDLMEAAKCYHSGLHKGAVVIARRAVQLAFEDKIPGLDRTKRWMLGGLIEEARKIDPPMITNTGFSHADIVCQFGNSGAHHRVVIDPRDARTVVWAAVQVLTELAPLASQPEPDSNEQ